MHPSERSGVHVVTSYSSAGFLLVQVAHLDISILRSAGERPFEFRNHSRIRSHSYFPPTSPLCLKHSPQTSAYLLWDAWAGRQLRAVLAEHLTGIIAQDRVNYAVVPLLLRSREDRLHRLHLQLHRRGLVGRETFGDPGGCVGSGCKVSLRHETVGYDETHAEAFHQCQSDGQGLLACRVSLQGWAYPAEVAPVSAGRVVADLGSPGWNQSRRIAQWAFVLSRSLWPS